MVRIIVADDHAVVREGISRILALAPDIVVTGEAKNGWEAIELARRGDSDVLMMDMNMPGPCGVELIRRLHDEAPRLRVLVFSVHDEPQVASRAIKAGAAGYLTKDSEPEAILAGVMHVAAGGHAIEPRLAARLLFSTTSMEESHPRSLLTDREFEVFLRLARGQSINGVADALHLSAKTVSTHKHRLTKKLGLASMSELVRCAIRYGVIDKDVST
ncbi:MAG: response regulator transcription factor [Halothiobacillaceae bacterium]|nr:response regulator transcription factor [Halothiobacillaceae bacterium]